MNTALTTARKAGLAYLGLAVSGLVGFLLIRSQLVEAGDGIATAANLVAHEGLARLGVAAMLTVVLTQALAALYFFALFRPVDSFAAGALAAFGMMNSAAILLGSACAATALEVALAGGSPDSVDLLTRLDGAAWGVGGLFFGLWLIPMGWLTLRSGSMPALLGWILIGGGVGYLLCTYVTYLAPSLDSVAALLPLPATVGELWMVGYLLIRGGHLALDGATPREPAPVAG